MGVLSSLSCRAIVPVAPLGAFISFARAKETEAKVTPGHPWPRDIRTPVHQKAPHLLAGSAGSLRVARGIRGRQNGHPWPCCRRVAHPALAPAGLNRILRTMLGCIKGERTAAGKAAANTRYNVVFCWWLARSVLLAPLCPLESRRALRALEGLSPQGQGPDGRSCHSMARDGHSVVPLKGLQRAGPAGRLSWASVFLVASLSRLTKKQLAGWRNRGFQAVAKMSFKPTFFRQLLTSALRRKLRLEHHTYRSMRSAPQRQSSKQHLTHTAPFFCPSFFAARKRVRCRDAGLNKPCRIRNCRPLYWPCFGAGPSSRQGSDKRRRKPFQWIERA